MGTVFINGEKNIWIHDVRKVRSPGCPFAGIPGESPQSRVGEQPVVVDPIGVVHGCDFIPNGYDMSQGSVPG